MSNDFKSKLKALRKEKKLSQQVVADKLKVQRSTYGHWETGRNEPSLLELVKISNLFNCTLEYLIDPSISKNHILFKNGITKDDYESIINDLKENK